MVRQGNRQAEGVEVPQVKVHRHDFRVEVPIEHGRLPTSRVHLRRVLGRVLLPFGLLEPIGGHLQSAQECRVQILDIPSEAVEHQRVDGVRNLVGQRHPCNRCNAKPDVGHLVILHAANLSRLQQLDDMVDLLDNQLRLNFVQGVGMRRVAGPDQVEGQSGIALGVHAAGPGVLLRLPRPVPHDLAECSAVDEHLDGVLLVGGLRRWRAVDTRDVVGRRPEIAEVHEVMENLDAVVVIFEVTVRVLGHIERNHQVGAAVAGLMLETVLWANLGRVGNGWPNQG